jgi:hypothetical protein
VCVCVYIYINTHFRVHLRICTGALIRWHVLLLLLLLPALPAGSGPVHAFGASNMLISPMFACVCVCVSLCVCVCV